MSKSQSYPLLGKGSLTTARGNTNFGGFRLDNVGAINSTSFYGIGRQYLRDWDAQIAKISDGTASSKATVVWIGDSLSTYGYCFSDTIRTWLFSKFGNAGDGFIPAGIELAATPQGVVRTTSNTPLTWSGNYISTYGIAISYLYGGTGTEGRYQSYQAVCTDFVIHYIQESGGGSFRYQLDGGAWIQTVSTDDTPTKGTFVSTGLTGLTEGSHTVNIEIVTDGVKLVGVECRRDRNGVRMHNLAIGGSKSSDWSNADSSWESTLQQFDAPPNLFVISLGANDISASITVAQHKTNIKSIIDRVIAIYPNASILLFSTIDRADALTPTAQQYVAADKELAVEYGYGFIDNLALLGDHTTSQSRGMQEDDVHITTEGGRLIALNFINYLCANTYSSAYQEAFQGDNTFFFTDPAEDPQFHLTSGIHNLGAGARALYALTTGSYNLALGWRALYRLTTGNSNFALGDSALINLTTGRDNVGVGDHTLISLTSGNYNIAIGTNTLKGITTQSLNTAIGYFAGIALTSENNTAIGALSLQGVATGSNNTTVGYYSSRAITSGYENAVIGGSAAYNLTTGYGNCIIGRAALYNATTCNYNVVIGNAAGNSASLGSSNVIIGRQAGYYETGSSKLFIDNIKRADEADARIKALIYGVFDAATANQYITINGGLNVGGGVTPVTPGDGIVNAQVGFQCGTTAGATAGPFTAITSITVKGGIVTVLTGS